MTGNMAISEEFCDPIHPCTWYRDGFLCTQPIPEEVMGRKHVSFLQKLLDEMTSIIESGKGDRAVLLQTIVGFMENLGLTGEEISDILESRHEPEYEPETEIIKTMVTVTENLFLTILVLAVLNLVTTKIGMPDHMAFCQSWIYALCISSTWCDLFYAECPVYLTPMVFLSKYFPMLLICWTLQFFSHEFLMILNVFFTGRHFVLDFILQGLVLANLSLEQFLHKLCEKSYELWELIFDAIETLFGRSARLCKLLMEKLLGHTIETPAMLELTEGKKHFYRCILLMVCLTWQDDAMFRGICIGSIMQLFWVHFGTAVGNTQLWQRWLNTWEGIKERLCEDYFKMPGGLQPHRYHTRYSIGLMRIRLFEYGIRIQVLPDLTHMGIRCFTFCGIQVFQGEPVPVPVAQYA